MPTSIPSSLAAIALLALAGCATPAYFTSDSALANAEFAIEAAVEEAGVHVSVEIEAAKAKLEQAKQARESGQPSLSIRLAQEATVDAQLAEAMALKARAEE